MVHSFYHHTHTTNDEYYDVTSMNGYAFLNSKGQYMCSQGWRGTGDMEKDYACLEAVLTIMRGSGLHSLCLFCLLVGFVLRPVLDRFLGRWGCVERCLV